MIELTRHVAESIERTEGGGGDLGLWHCFLNWPNISLSNPTLLARQSGGAYKTPARITTSNVEYYSK